MYRPYAARHRDTERCADAADQRQEAEGQRAPDNPRVPQQPPVRCEPLDDQRQAFAEAVPPRLPETENRREIERLPVTRRGRPCSQPPRVGVQADLPMPEVSHACGD